MTRSTFRVLFYANGSKEKNGIVPIMGRVTINGTVAQFSCKRSIAKELWDAKGNRAKGKSREARKKHLSKGDRNEENQTQPVVNKRFFSCLPLQPNSRERQDNARFPLPSHYLFRYLPEA